MKSKLFTTYLAGIMTAVLLMSVVMATGVIKNVEFNSNKVILNGNNLELSEQMISVTKEGEDGFRNYMPVRAVLEAMGYNVDWDNATNSVLVNNNYLITSGSVTESGLTIRDVFLSEYNLDVDSTDINDFVNTISPRVFVPLIIDDYLKWRAGENALFGDVYKKMSE